MGCLEHVEVIRCNLLRIYPLAQITLTGLVSYPADGIKLTDSVGITCYQRTFKTKTRATRCPQRLESRAFFVPGIGQYQATCRPNITVQLVDFTIVYAGHILVATNKYVLMVFIICDCCWR
ncbi:Uncharacterized protein Rs2_13363 [Raphanus sativus]|nr:Uncharacterized protein Rs2_13363 [Raphanus sativus]